MDDLELLTRLRPETEDPDPVALARHRLALLNRDTNPGAVTRRWSMPRMAIGATVVAAITAVSLVVGLSGGHEEPTAVELLAQAADVAADTPTGTGDWAYTSDVIVYNSHTVRRQMWDKTDGTDGLVREDRDGKVEEFRTADLSEMFEPSLGHPTYNFLATLPTDPTALRDEIYRHAQSEITAMGPTGQQLYTVDQWAFQLAGRLVQSAAPPALKAALYRVAATIPEVAYVDNATDAAGRQGIGVAHTVNNDGDRAILIFDRTTYQVMGHTVEIHDGGTDSQAVLATGLVAEAGQTP